MPNYIMGSSTASLRSIRTKDFVVSTRDSTHNGQEWDHLLLSSWWSGKDSGNGSACKAFEVKL